MAAAVDCACGHPKVSHGRCGFGSCAVDGDSLGQSLGATITPMPKSDDVVQTQIRLPADLWARIKAHAQADRRSANQVVTMALEAAFPAVNAPHKKRQAG